MAQIPSTPQRKTANIDLNYAGKGKAIGGVNNVTPARKTVSAVDKSILPRKPSGVTGAGGFPVQKITPKSQPYN